MAGLQLSGLQPLPVTATKRYHRLPLNTVRNHLILIFRSLAYLSILFFLEKYSFFIIHGVNVVARYAIPTNHEMGSAHLKIGRYSLPIM